MPAKFSILAVSAMPILSLSLACGGDDDGGGGGGITVPDAATGGSGQMDAPAQATCYVDPMYTPNFGSNQGAETSGSGSTGSNAHTILWGAALDAAQPPDVIQLELYAGIGAFMGADISPKTITISGDELNYKTCSVCVRIFADATQQASAAQYLATSGTVTLTKVAGTLEGTLTNVALTKVTVAQDYTSTPVNDGCNTMITNATINAAIMMGSATADAPIARQVNAQPFVLTNRRY